MLLTVKEYEETRVRVQKHDASWCRALQQRDAFINAIEVLWNSHSWTRLASHCIAIWRSYTLRCASVQRLITEREIVVSWAWVATGFIVWSAEVGQHLVEELQHRVHRTKAELPRQVRFQCAVKVNRALDWTPAGVLTCSGCSLELHLAFLAWRGVLQSVFQRRVAVQQLLHRDSPLCSSEDLVLLELCLLKWCASLCQAEATLSVEGTFGQGSLDKRRVWDHMIYATFLENLSVSIRAILVSWHQLVIHIKLRRDWEQAFTQQENFDEKCRSRDEELKVAEEELQMQQAQHRMEHTQLQEDLSKMQSEFEDHRNDYLQTLEECKFFEQQRSQSEASNQILVNELASMQVQIMNTQKQVRMAQESSDYAQAEAEQREAMYEEEAVSAQLDLHRVEGELSKHRERRLRAVRDARQQLKAQIARSEEASHRIEHQRELDKVQWADRLQEAEIKKARIEADVHELREAASNVVPRAEMLEMENAQLFERCHEMEDKLINAEGAEHRRRQELKDILDAHERQTARVEAMEQDLAFRTRSRLRSLGDLDQFREAHERQRTRHEVKLT